MRWKNLGVHAAVMITAFILTPIAVCILGGLVHLLFYVACSIGILLFCLAAVLIGIDLMKAAHKWLNRRKKIFC